MNRPISTLVGLTLVAILATAGFAAVPNLINFQGRLTTAGVPVSDSTYAVVFGIYDAPVGGQLLWTETHAGVAINQGLFSVLLGSLVPFTDSVFGSPNRFLDVRVGTESIVPRSQLTSVGFAQRVGTVDGSTGGEISGNLIVTQAADQGSFSFANPNISAGRIVVGFNDGTPALSLYEPIDSRVRDGSVGERKSMEMSGGQIVVFGTSEFDTNLVVSPNGDIVGVGQITMGMNSSSGFQTTVLGHQNTAQGDSSTVGGGSGNLAAGMISVIAGGHGNTATGEGSTISGGANNQASGPYATVPGGSDNSASGSHAVAAGGENNDAAGDWSFAAGRRAKAITHGSFVWADHEDADFSATAEDQFLVRARGGVGIGTSVPMGMLEVSGPPGDSIVNLPNSSLAAPEMLDEPGIAASVSDALVTLTQNASTPQTLTQVSIELPAPGFVMLRGGTTLKLHGTSHRNQGYIQIVETANSSLSPSARIAGTGENDSPNSYHYFDLDVDQVFFRPAGVHTFYLEGMAHPQNGSGATTTLVRPTLIATYFPTSYGAVAGFVTSAESGQYGDTEPAAWPNVSDSLATLSTDQFYKVDMRELELAAMRARSQAAILEKQLLEAKLRQQSATSER